MLEIKSKLISTKSSLHFVLESRQLLYLGTRQLLCLRRCGDVLPVHEVRPPLHLRPLHHHPHGARRSPPQRIWYSLRGTALC